MYAGSIDKDYLADRLVISREEVVHSILLMREEGLLADFKDLTACIQRTESRNKSEQTLRRYMRLEQFMLDHISDGEKLNLRELNDLAIRSGIKTATVRQMKTILFFWTIVGEYRKRLDTGDCPAT